MQKYHRQFDNPLNLTAKRAWDRLYPLDNAVVVSLEDSNLLSVDSTLTDSIINLAFSNINQPEPVFNRHLIASNLLVSSGLWTALGRNITTVNNNADRDFLLQVICYLLGITDENGVIQASSPEIVPQSNSIEI